MEPDNDTDDIDYINVLSDTTWLDIFNKLDGSDIIKLCLTCHRFKELVSSSKLLLKKLKFSINFPEESGEELKNIKKGLEACSITRNYTNLQVNRLRDKILNNDMRDIFLSIISRLAETAINLEINNCYLLRDDMISILQSFKYLVELKLVNIIFSDDLMPSEIIQFENETTQSLSCPNLRVLQLIQCDFYCLLLLKSHDKLHTLEISIASYNRPDVEKLENFLLKQSHLKDLKLTHFRFNSTYSSDRLAKVPFQLEKLYLKDVCWDIKDHCSLFLKSQKMLKHFEIKRIRQWVLPKESNFVWFCDQMKYVLGSEYLKEIVIDTSQSSVYLKDSEFLTDYCNNHVKKLTYIRDSTDTSELYKIIPRIFPNIHSFVFVDLPQDRNSSDDMMENLFLFKNLKELSITTKPSCLSKLTQNIAENLISFYYYATNEDKSLDRLKQIFSGNPKIQYFGLSIEALTIEEIIELIINFSSTLRSLSVGDIHLNVIEAELFIQNFPNLRYLSSDVSFSQDVLNVFKENNITFKKCNGSIKN